MQERIQHPTIRSLAAELGVAPITVSRALRGMDLVKPVLAARIRKHAERRGYRRDPLVAEVLGSLGRRSGVRYRETVAFVWTHELGGAEEEQRGAQAAAEMLGYRLDVIRPGRESLREEDVSRILRARGIRGVLLSPNSSGPSPSYHLEWKHFATVLVGSSLVNTGLTRVARDYFHDAKLALGELRHAGFRKIALALDASIHERTDRRYAAAFSTYGGSGRIYLVDSRRVRRHFEAWLAKAKPDALLSESQLVSGWVPRTIPNIRLHLRAEDPGAGIRPDFRRVGSEAMVTLDGLLRAGRFGRLNGPVTILVPGQWVGPRHQSDWSNRSISGDPAVRRKSTKR